MGTAYVDNIKEQSLGHGVHIPGHIIQVQKSVITSGVQATSSTYLDTGHSLLITPKFANSQILLQNYAAGWHYSAGSPNSRGLRITRNGTEIVTNDGQGYTEDGAWATMSWVTAFFDTTHNSTSQLEYRLLVNGNRARFNDWAGYQLNTATFLAMEIAQ
tara:strand:- start:382 stop:858 length:477 start_codon:yes stop_codon:yes gene_type:complete